MLMTGETAWRFPGTTVRTCHAVAAGTFNLTFRPVTFSLKSFHADPGGYSRNLAEALNGH
jgi:hypothetical protein